MKIESVCKNIGLNEPEVYLLGMTLSGQKITDMRFGYDRHGRYVQIYVQDKVYRTVFDPDIIDYLQED